MNAERDAAIGMIDTLVQRGHAIKSSPAVDLVRGWQRDCAAAINQLSGGSKAHWLSRAFSGAFLIRAADGGVVVEASASEIVDRILDVLAQARSALSNVSDAAAASDVDPASQTRRFEFVHNPQLRPILAQAFADGARALDDGDAQTALVASCSVLEAVITDALESKGLNVPDWSFDARIQAAQRAGLIGGGCARLTPAARGYRDPYEGNGHGRAVSERDARVARQVLLVVMRDLDPGR